jgi:hypothetical protein
LVARGVLAAVLIAVAASAAKTTAGAKNAAGVLPVGLRWSGRSPICLLAAEAAPSTPATSPLVFARLAVASVLPLALALAETLSGCLWHEVLELEKCPSTKQ